MIRPEDEAPHAVGRERYWQESWYFNWADRRHDLIGVARIGIRPNERQADGLVFAIRNGRPDFAYAAIHTRDYALSGSAAGATAQAGRLVFSTDAPLRQWHVGLDTRRAHIDLRFSAFNSAYDYRDGDDNMPAGIAARHFEQSGRVEGTCRWRGRSFSIDGLGQRDKSWGVRDWANIAGWDWISAQFGEELSFNAWQAPYRGKRYIGGFVFRDGENHALESLTIEYEWPPRHRGPRGVRLVLGYAGGELVIVGTACGRFPLAFRGLWLDEVFTTFEVEGAGRSYPTGVGIIEHAHHISRLGLLRRAPDIGATLWRVLVPSFG